ncbi:protein-glutamate O-methyltransferase CheR [Ramlibacter sp. 2FC]|uniref:CheR family methyltransferase n=1 Tax=Ramlibacter sp. 2FC TaxID=2502188 RepID=UPI0010F99752|nr:protein-glutamate O-methyltransferase CheR [Ramlibacter sp. 2FC]
MGKALSETQLARLSELVGTRLGLHFPPERWSDLARGMAAAATDFDLPDAAACAQRLLSAPLSDADVERLATYLTVGETYFFRDRALFDLLEGRILPELLQARCASAPQLRIWSAGCATGEEPYSVAMLLDRLLPRADPLQVSLLGTDINPEFLRRAVQGEYGAWSFRDTPAWVQERYFERRPDGRLRLHERIRRCVTWAVLNLAEDSYPSLASNTFATDLILCRNVLMYFGPAQAAAVVERLHRALRPGGWLVVTPAEMSSALFTGFTPVTLDGVTLYRKSALAPALRDAAVPARSPFVPSPGRWMPAAPRSLAVEPPRDPRRLALTARALADQGRFDEALAWCQRAIAADKLRPAAHYLLATIQQEQGQADAAAQSLARALYLEPDFILAHFALGSLRRAQGRAGEAARHFGRALVLLQDCPADETVPESEGLHAGRLAEVVRLALANLQQTQGAAGRAPLTRRQVHER